MCFDNQCTKEHRRYYCTRVISYRTARRPGGHVGVGEVVLETCFHFSNKKFVEFFSFLGDFLLKSVTPKTKSCELSSTLFYCRDLRDVSLRERWRSRCLPSTQRLLRVLSRSAYDISIEVEVKRASRITGSHPSSLQPGTRV